MYLLYILIGNILGYKLDSQSIAIIIFGILSLFIANLITIIISRRKSIIEITKRCLVVTIILLIIPPVGIG